MVVSNGILPNRVVSAESDCLNASKTKEDKFWSYEEIMYDYHTEIQGTRSQSEVAS